VTVSDEPATAGRFAWERALLDSWLPPMTRLTGLALATFANRDGSNARPGEARLAQATGLSTRRVRDHMTELRGYGWIVRVSRGGSRTKTTDGYQLTIPDHHRTSASAEPGHITGPHRPEKHNEPTLNLRTLRTESPDAANRISGRERPPTMFDQDRHHADASRRPLDRGAPRQANHPVDCSCWDCLTTPTPPRRQPDDAVAATP
jgi:Helix-turn-helix domain